MDNKRKQISLVDSYKKFMSSFTDEHVLYLQILLAILVVCITAYVFSKRVIRSISRANSIILVGGCEAGKTSLLYTLTNKGNMPLTVTSFKENVSSFQTDSNKSIRLVDIPGHERVRSSAFDRHKSDARAIIFMLDSASVQTNVRDVAEQLFTVLTDSTVRSSGCPIAVVCNKQDHELAKAASVIERALQREIDVLRETASSRLASIETDSSSKNNASVYIGKPGQNFSFSDIDSNKITFLEATVLDSSHLDEIRTWISNVA